MTDAIDVANGFDGSYNGGVGVPGLVARDGAVYFNAAAYVLLPGLTFLPGASDFSLVVWIEPDNAFDGDIVLDFIFSFTAEATLFLLADQTVRFTGIGAAPTSLDGTVPITPGARHMIAFTRKTSGEVWSIYVDGALDISQAVAAKTFTGTGGNGTIGGTPSQVGVYDEVATFYSELSSGDIADLWDARDSFAAYNALILSLNPRNYYHLDDLGPGPAIGGWSVGRVGVHG